MIRVPVNISYTTSNMCYATGNADYATGNNSRRAVRISRLRHILLVVVALASSIASWAQVSFRVDAPTLVAEGETMRVEFSVNAEPERGSFTPPSFEGFDVVAGPSQSTGHTVSFSNGRQTSSYNSTITYILIPQRTGTHTIGAASIIVDGRTYSTTPTLIEVVTERTSSNDSGKGNNRGSKGNSGSPESRIAHDDLLLRLKISDSEVYKGEYLRASLVLYSRVPLSNIESLTMPALDNFWTLELTGDGSPSREEYNGKVYDTYKITEYLLSPLQSGRLTIPEALMTVSARVEVTSGRYDPFFGGRQIYNVPRDLRSAPVTINVLDYPAGAPASFNGAVGNLSMTSTMPESDITVNSSNRVEITISGSGNLEFITAPRITFPDSFEVYDTQVRENFSAQQSGTSGSITYIYPFVARSTGEFTIEPVEFTYFNPATASYQTLSTDRITLNISDDGSSTTAVGGYTNFGGSMRQLDRDIRFVHTGALPKVNAAMFIFSPMYWLSIVSIVALFIVVYVVMRRRIRENRNVVARRMKHADKVAVQRLRMAQHSMNEGNRHKFYEEMLRAMWGYISDKFNIPVSNLTKETIREELYRRGVSTTEAEQFCDIISRSDEAQYAPSTDGDMGEVYADAVDVITKIESVIKR